MNECQTSLDKLAIELDELKKTISESMSKKGQLEKDTLEIEDKLRDIRELGPDSACPTCERPLKDHFEFLEEKFHDEQETRSKQLMEHTLILKASILQLDDTEKRHEALKKREKFLNIEISKFGGSKETIKSLEFDLKQTEKQEKDLSDEMKNYKKLKFDADEYDRVKASYQELEHVKEQFIKLKERTENKPKLEKELKTLQAAISTLQTKHDKYSTQLDKLGFDLTQQNEIENEFDKQSVILNMHMLKLKEKENDHVLLKNKIEQLTIKIKEHQAHEQKVEEYQEKSRYLTKLAKVLDNFKTYMISRIAPTLTQFASELFREMTDGRYNRLEVDSDYNVFIYDNGQEFPLERFSGGEEDLANLCLRLAISQVIAIQSGTTGPNFVILDEIFGSQDLNRKRNLLQALNSLTTKFRQIFLITHIEDVKDFIGFNIYVTENEDDTDTSSIRVIS
jgi:exonuclease SbcC